MRSPRTCSPWTLAAIPPPCVFTAGSSGNDSANAVALDKHGNIYVVGDFTGTIPMGKAALTSVGSSHCFLASFTSACTLRWAVALGGSSSDVCDGVAVNDVADRVYVLGAGGGTIEAGSALETASGSRDVLLAAYDRDGVFKWLKLFGKALTTVGHGIALDPLGNITMVGITSGPVDLGSGEVKHHGSNDVFILSLDPAGNHRWDARIGGSGYDFGDAVAADNTGNVYVAAGIFDKVMTPGFETLKPAGQQDLVLASYTAAGTLRWTQSYGGVQTERPWALTLHNSQLYVTGTAKGQPNLGGGLLSMAKLSDTFVASYKTKDGTHNWSTLYGSSTDDWGMGIDTDGAGNVYVIGIHNAGFTISSSPVQHKGGTDLFLSSFTAGGVHRWTQALGGPKLDTGLGLAVDIKGTMHAVGYFQGTVDFDGRSKTSAGYQDAFMVRYRR